MFFLFIKKKHASSTQSCLPLPAHSSWTLFSRQRPACPWREQNLCCLPCSPSSNHDVLQSCPDGQESGTGRLARVW